jgi:hypothetical protein
VRRYVEDSQDIWTETRFTGVVGDELTRNVDLPPDAPEELFERVASTLFRFAMLVAFRRVQVERHVRGKRRHDSIALSWSHRVPFVLGGRPRVVGMQPNRL